MSYDVYIGDEGFNYTSNVAPLFYDHIPQERSRGGLHELHGLTGKQAAAVLGQAFERLMSARRSASDDARFCAKYDAPNGWGSTLGAILFLGNIMAACAANPRKKVDVSA